MAFTSTRDPTFIPLVGILSQERFKAKLVVILGGYDEEINQHPSVNPGLSSPPPRRDCIREHVFRDVHRGPRGGASKGEYRDRLVGSSQPCVELINLFSMLSELPSWGNVRDVITTSKKKIRTAIGNSLSSPQQGSGPLIALSAPGALAGMGAAPEGFCGHEI